MILDYTDEIHEKVIELALSDVSCRITTIWMTLSDEINSRSTAWKGMSDAQVKTLVFNTRSRENGGDIFRLLERPPLCMVHNSNFFFLQFNQTIFDNETKKVERIMVYGNPFLFGILSGGVQLYIDGTFRIYPS